MKLNEELKIKSEGQNCRNVAKKVTENKDDSKLSNNKNTKAGSLKPPQYESLPTARSEERSSSADNIAEKTMFINSPLISWIKQELYFSWLREKSLKDYIS